MVSRHCRRGASFESVLQAPKGGSGLRIEVSAYITEEEKAEAKTHLQLRPKVDSLRSVQQHSAEHGSVRTGPREHGERYGDGAVDSELAPVLREREKKSAHVARRGDGGRYEHVDLLLKLAGGGTRLGEDGVYVTVYTSGRSSHDTKKDKRMRRKNTCSH
jgi:hypothetical protein